MEEKGVAVKHSQSSTTPAPEERKREPGATSRIPGFYKLELMERLDKLGEWLPLSAREKWVIKQENLHADMADMMIENAVGVFGLPLGMALNFRINGKDHLVPMAIEETSVVAAASNAARLVRAHGCLTAEAGDQVMISQIQLVNVPDPEKSQDHILARKEHLLRVANEQDPQLVDLGGGARDLQVRIIDTQSGLMLIVHLLVDTRDAMGANVVNTMAEALSPLLEDLTGGSAICRIVSNYADQRLVRARMELPVADLARAGFSGEEAAERLIQAYHFAEADPYRAATHNKGVMNGIDAVVIATGNDWRAVEAGVHAYASRSGSYKPITSYHLEGDKLVGEIEIPLALGIIGGVTKIHPAVKILLRILKVESSAELAEVTACAGLLQISPPSGRWPRKVSRRDT